MISKVFTSENETTKHLELFPTHTTSSPFQSVGLLFLTSFKPYISIFMLSLFFNRYGKGLEKPWQKMQTGMTTLPLKKMSLIGL